MVRPIARIDFGVVQNPPNVDLWVQKVDFLNLTPLALLQKPHFGPFYSWKWTVGWFAVVCQTPLHPSSLGYGPANLTLKNKERKNNTPVYDITVHPSITWPGRYRTWLWWQFTVPNPTVSLADFLLISLQLFTVSLSLHDQALVNPLCI